MAAAITLKRKSWTKLAEELETDVRTLKTNCKSLMRQLNRIEGKEKFRVLSIKSQQIIKKHLSII